MNTNSENPKVGKTFQEIKNHKFDCVSDDKKIVVGCKCYT